MNSTILQFAIPKCQLLKLPELSHYNFVLTGLPFPINNCDVLCDSYDGGETWNGYSIGTVDLDGVYTPAYWLHTDQYESDIAFDSSLISDTNRWT